MFLLLLMARTLGANIKLANLTLTIILNKQIEERIYIVWNKKEEEEEKFLILKRKKNLRRVQSAKSRSANKTTKNNYIQHKTTTYKLIIGILNEQL